MVDLSVLGCLLRSPAALAGGAVVDLQLELPDGTLLIKARVAEASVDGSSLATSTPSYLSGLEFLSLGPDEETRLRRFVETQSRRRGFAHPPPA